MRGLSRHLDGAGIPHAFGGGLVLPLYGQIRATDDIDVGVFVGVDEADGVFSALRPMGIDVDFSADDRDKIASGGWVTVGFDGTPVDIFFACSAMHLESAHRVRHIKLGGEDIPVLGPEDFVAHKALFGRPRDWEDIDSVLAANPGLDHTVVARWLSAEGGDRAVRRRIVSYCGADPASGGAAQVCGRAGRRPAAAGGWSSTHWPGASSLTKADEPGGAGGSVGVAFCNTHDPGVAGGFYVSDPDRRRAVRVGQGCRPPHGPQRVAAAGSLGPHRP